VNVCQQGFRSVASLGFGGQESASKPPQAICKPLPNIMKNLITLFIFCFSLFSFSQDKFYEAIIELGNDLEYFPESISGNKNYIDESSVVKWFKKSIEFCSEHDSKINEIDFDEFVSAKSTHIKSKKPLKGKTYLRVTVEEWTFKSEKNAIDFISKFRLANLECLNKGGIEFWRIKEKIYLIVSGATMFSYKFNKIKESMDKVLN